MDRIRSVSVFCGARDGDSRVFRAAAEQFGEGLAKAGIRLVFGGGRVGLMGAVANAVMEAGGEVLGVIPEFLTRVEIAHAGITKLIVTDSMHARKLRMYELSDAFVSLPGGLGTLDETIEIITWAQLALHNKPIVLCDVANSAAPLLAAIDASIAQGFADSAVRTLFHVARGPTEALDLLHTLPPGKDITATRL